MSDWTNIPADTFETDRPVLGSTHLAIVQNFEALAEGAAGAPRVSLLSLARLVDGDTIRARNDDTRDFSAELQTSNWITVWEVAVIQWGTVNVSFEHRRDSGPGRSGVRIRRLRGDGTSVIAQFDSGGTYSKRIVNLSVQPGDTIQWQHRVEDGINNFNTTVQIRRMRLLLASGVDYYPIPASEYRARVEGSPNAT